MRAKFYVLLQLISAMVTVFTVGTSSAHEFHGMKTANYSGMDGAMSYLSEFGYMGPKMDHTHMSMADMKDVIMDFQEMCSLKQTGDLDPATIKMMNTPRCANKDHVLQPHRHRRRQFEPNYLDRNSRPKRYVVHGSKWEKNIVTYRVVEYTRQAVFSHQVDQTIAQAFQIWEREINLQFQKSESQPADIEIRFAHGPHGDNFPFTGNSEYTLAHGFYPGSGLGGDIHFNEAMNWTDKGNLLYTAVHEIGHALGLRHSADQNAIMFPHFLNYDPDVKLQSDDIEGIQKIYGYRRGSSGPNPAAAPTSQPKPHFIPSSRPAAPPQAQPQPPVAPPAPSPPRTRKPGVPNRDGDPNIWKTTSSTTKAPIVVHRASTTTTTVKSFAVTTNRYRDIDTNFHTRRQSEFCQNGKVDAIVTLANGMTYVFRGAQILPLRLENGEFEAEPILKVSEVFGGQIPPDIDAAFTQENEKTYIFKGDAFWRTTNAQVDSGYPKKIEHHFPGIPNDINSAFVGSDDHIYFFKENKFWKFNKDIKPPVSSVYPLKYNRAESGIPGDIDAVFRSPQGQTFFFKLGRYWRFDDKAGTMAVSEDKNAPYPRDARIWWFSCTDIKPNSSLK